MPMPVPLPIATGFSLRYGLLFGWLAAALDAEYFEVVGSDLDPYLAGELDELGDEAKQHGESSLVRSWLEYLIACRPEDLAALGIPWLRSRTDMVLPIPGLGGLPEEAWQYILQFMRNRLFGVREPMSEDEKAGIRRSVTIIDETLEDFRKRMRDEGRLDPPSDEER